MNFVAPKAADNHKLLLNKPDSCSLMKVIFLLVGATPFLN